MPKATILRTPEEQAVLAAKLANYLLEHFSVVVVAGVAAPSEWSDPDELNRLLYTSGLLNELVLSFTRGEPISIASDDQLQDICEMINVKLAEPAA